MKRPKQKSALYFHVIRSLWPSLENGICAGNPTRISSLGPKRHHALDHANTTWRECITLSSFHFCAASSLSNIASDRRTKSRVDQLFFSLSRTSSTVRYAL